VGIILVIVGLTGSLLVFEHEMDEWAIQQRFGHVVPQEQRLSTGNVGRLKSKQAYSKSS
jgi:uncharacterized iron-regulated membrane protein